MLPLLTIFSTLVVTYTSSLKKDLADNGFEIILLIVSIAWIDLFILLGVYLLGWFQMPSDPMFYLFWSGLTLLYTIQFSLFIFGLKHSKFLAANTFPSLGFVFTALYAFIFLGEELSTLKILALCLATAGALLFFDWRSKTRNNKGLLVIILSLLCSPFLDIFYKAASLHTHSFGEFLTGRLVMDFVYYTAIFLAVFIFWYRKNPWSSVKAFVSQRKSWTYMVSTAAVSLLDSWLIFMMPISTFTMLRRVSIPAGYVIGKYKYGERIEPRYVIGGILIIVAIVMFL